MPTYIFGSVKLLNKITQNDTRTLDILIKNFTNLFSTYGTDWFAFVNLTNEFRYEGAVKFKKITV